MSQTEKEKVKPTDELADKHAECAAKRGVQVDQSTIEVQIGRVSPSKLMLRPADESYVKEVAKSMSSIGQLEPILARPLPDEFVEVVDGHHRLEAAKQLGWATIRCRVVHMSDAEAFQTAEAAHILRNHNVDPIAEGNGFSLLRNQGLSEEKIGQNIGKSQQYVSARLALLRLEPIIRALVTSRLVKTELAYEIARLEDPRKRKLLAEMARTDRPHPLTLSELRELAKAAWSELFKNERAKPVLLEDPAECGRLAITRLEELDGFLEDITGGEWKTIEDWFGEREIDIQRMENKLDWLTRPGIWKRDHCANYDGDICSQWEWKHQEPWVSMKQIGNVWALRVSLHTELCATCPFFQRKAST